MSENSEFTADKAKAILSSVLEAIELPENATKIGEAKDNAGNDMLKMMQFVFPLVMQIEMDVIKKFGFSEGRDGIVNFAQALRTLEREDTEVAHLHAQTSSPEGCPTSLLAPCIDYLIATRRQLGLIERHLIKKKLYFKIS